MKLFSALAVLAAVAVVSNASAEEFKSGLQSGDFIGAFNVTKCAGAAEDGVEVGANLCYRCKNGGRPQVIIFTRSTDSKKVVALVKELDKAIAKHEEKQLRAFVNVLGESKDTLSEQAEKMAKSAKVSNVPFVVPNEFENGPEDYGINPKAEITVIMATGGQVKANHAVASADKLAVKAVLADIEKILE